CARRSVEMAEAWGDDQVRGLAAMTLASTISAMGEFEQAELSLAKAVEHFRRAGDQVGVMRSTIGRGSVARSRFMTAEAERLLRDAADTARAENARLALDEALSNLSVLFMESGRWKEARDADSESLRLSLEDARPRNAVLALTNLAVNDALAGSPHSAW